MNALRTVILVVAVAALLKSVWMLLWPNGVKATVDWWGKMPVPAARLLGYSAMVAGLVLLGAAVAQMHRPVLAASTVLGTVWVVFGMLYQWPPVFAAMNRPFGPEGKDWIIRAFGVALLLLALVLGYICYLELRAG